MFPAAGRQVPAQAGGPFVPAMWLTILGLWTLAVVQPLLGSLARSPEFFVAHRAGPVDILLLWLTLQILLPGLLVGGVFLARRAGRRAGTVAETGVLALLAASLALQVVKVGVGSWKLAVPMAAAGGVVAVLAHRRLPGVRLFTSLLAWASMIVVPLLFFGAPGMRSLLAPGVGAAPGTQPPGAAQPKPVPVVLIVFDELPVVSLMDAERRLDRVHYPHL
ncbi:MAG TPA: hypothetical protein VF136_06110, partial [Methylomirabilota bacterium]